MNSQLLEHEHELKIVMYQQTFDAYTYRSQNASVQTLAVSVSCNLIKSQKSEVDLFEFDIRSSLACSESNSFRGKISHPLWNKEFR